MPVQGIDSTRARGPRLASVDGRTYPLESVRIEARAEGGIAMTRLVQKFANPHDEPLEVIYTLPLPADGAVLGYTMRVGEKTIRGEIEARERAEARYREALAEGKTAGLLEQDRADTFQQRLGNLPSHVPVEIEIEVLQPLAFLVGESPIPPRWEYRFPTVVGVRYEGESGRVADADRLDVDRDRDGNIPTRVHFELAIAGWPGGEARVESLDHDLRVEAAEGTARAVLAHAARLDRDFTLRWPACTREVGVHVAVGGGLPGDDGWYGLLTVVPPAAPEAAFPRDLTVLIDASGSMTGKPIQTAGRVVQELLRGLSAEDRFELIEFANQPRRLTKGLVQASPAAIARAVEAVSRIQAGGCTEMATALIEALRPERPGAQRQVVLVTDGYIGFEQKVFEVASQGLAPGSRLHCVGVGAAPARSLTHGISRAGRGVELFARSEAAAVETGRLLVAATARPVLTEVTVSGQAVVKVAPERPRDVMAGQPLLVSVELDRRGGALEVRGRLAGAAEPWVRQLEIPSLTQLTGDSAGGAGVTSTALPIGALFGREAIADVEASASLARDGDEFSLVEVERLGLRHRIASSRTSLVAIAEEPGVDPASPRRRERLAVELPAGVSAEGLGLLGFPGGGLAQTGDLAIMGRPFLTHHMCSRTRAASPRETVRPRIRIEGARVLRVDGQLLVLEFDVPVDGFLRPEGEVLVMTSDSRFKTATVVADRSTRREPLSTGLVVTMVLSCPNGETWREGETLTLEWRDELRDAGGTTRQADFVMTVPGAGR